MRGPEKDEEWEVLYHFTSMKTFYEIITKGKFKLFDITKSNDPLEGKFIIDSLEEAIFKMSSREWVKPDEAAFLRRAFHNFIEKISSSNRDSILVLAASFCVPRHELLLWKSYGDGGRGAALGFDKNKLIQFQNDNSGFKFGKISYLSKEEMVIRAIDFWNVFLKKHYHLGEYSFTSTMLYDLFQIYVDGYFKKEEANQDEVEYRLLNCSLSLEQYLIPGFGKKVDGYDFFASGDDIKIYYNLDIREKENKPGLITDIITGPINKASNTEIQFALCQNELSHCSVSKANWIAMR